MPWDNSIINLDEALERVLGHKDMYIRWLDNFFVPETMEKVFDSFKNRDYASAHEAVHKLKGTAANLAVTRLANQALNLDEKIKAQTPFNEMLEELDVLEDYYNEASNMYKGNREEIDTH